MNEEKSSLNTHDLVFWVLELQDGRPDAAEMIFRRIMARVERLARAMFKKFPRVGRFVDVDDVTQSSLIRLLAAFRQIRPTSRQHFYALSNEFIRRELLDLAKHYYGPLGAGTHLSDVDLGESAPTVEVDDLDKMTAFHEAVARLPPEEREAIGLSYYHGWNQVEIAELYQVSVRTVRRWQASAVERLQQAGLNQL